MALTETKPPTADDIAADLNWRGYSGETVTGGDAARHLEATLALLDKRGWTRTYTGDEDETSPLDGADETWKVKDLVLGLVRTVREFLKDYDGPLTLYGALCEIADTADGDSDTKTVADRCITAVLRQRTVADRCCLIAWAGRRGRTHEEIRDLLTEAAAFARKYGPTA